MTNPKLGNRLILLTLAIALAVGSLFTLWGVGTVTEKDLQQSSLTFGHAKVTGKPAASFMEGFLGIKPGTKIPVDGLHGQVALGPVSVPYWALVASVVLGLLLTVANSCRFADVPRKLVVGLLALCVLLMLWDVVDDMFRDATPRIGEFLAIAAAVIGLAQQRPLLSPAGTIAPLQSAFEPSTLT